MKKHAYTVAAVLLVMFACSLMRSSPTPPKITLEEQALFLQARAELAEAKNAVTMAEAKYAGIVNALQAKCPLTLVNGRPECAPPEPPGKKK